MTKVKQKNEIHVFHDDYPCHVWQEWEHTAKIAIIVESNSTDFSWADDLPFSDDESYTKWLDSDIFLCKYPLYIYDHSGIAFSIDNTVYPFSCGWDTALVGWIYVLKEGNEGMTRSEAKQRLYEDLDQLNIYYREGFLCADLVDDAGNILNSIGCYLGEDELIKAIKEEFPPESHSLISSMRYV